MLFFLHIFISRQAGIGGGNFILWRGHHTKTKATGFLDGT